MPLYNLGKGIFSLCLALSNVRENRNECKIVTKIRLQEPGEMFQKAGVKNFSMIAFDTTNQVFVVAAVDKLFLFRLTDFEMIHEVTLAPQQGLISSCAQSQSEEACHNHFKVLHIVNQNVFACGTSANNPSCTWRSVTNFTHQINRVSGYRKSPFRVEHAVTSVMTNDNFLYAGTALDTVGFNWGIIRTQDGNLLDVLETDVGDSWLWEPTFIASFEIGGFVYFFFNEKGRDGSVFEENIYARISRICKSDKSSEAGGVRKSMFLTFQKARMECTIQGDRALELRLQSVVFMPSLNCFFGLFSTPEGAVDASAVCEYSLAMVNRTFEGPFAVFNENSCKILMDTQQDMRNYQCIESAMAEERLRTSPRVLNYKMMGYALRGRSAHPLIIANNNRFHYLEALDITTRENGIITELFLANRNGLVSKVAIMRNLITEDTDQVPTCLFDTYNIFPTESNSTLLMMKYHEGTKSLYFGTNDKLLRVDTSLCDRFRSRRTCLAGGDPHCGWNSEESKCTSAPDNNPNDGSWSQNGMACAVPPKEHESDVSQIPGVSFDPEEGITAALPAVPVDPVHGGWSTWSTWQRCQIISPPTRRRGRRQAGRCVFRDRQCNNPRPAGTGRNCPGLRIQISGRGTGSSGERVKPHRILLFFFFYFSLRMQDFLP